MAINLTFNTQTQSNSGTYLSAAHIRLQVTLKPEEDKASIRLRVFEDEASYLAGRNEIWVDAVTGTLKIFETTMTAGQYANVDMGIIHDQLVGILEEGSAHANYPAEADQDWLGIQDIDILNLATKVMPS